MEQVNLYTLCTYVACKIVESQCFISFNLHSSSQCWIQTNLDEASRVSTGCTGLVIFSTIFFFTVNRQCRQCSEWRRLESQQFLQMTFWESQQSQLHHLPQDWNSYKSWGSDSKLHLLVYWKLSVKYKFNCRGLWSWSTNLFLFQLRVGCCLLVTLFTSLTESNDWTTCWHFTHFISCCQ